MLYAWWTQDSEVLAERVRCCLQETEEVTKDFTTLFDDGLFKFDTSLIPEVPPPPPTSSPSHVESVTVTMPFIDRHLRPALHTGTSYRRHTATTPPPRRHHAATLRCCRRSSSTASST